MMLPQVYMWIQVIQVQVKITNYQQTMQKPHLFPKVTWKTKIYFIIWIKADNTASLTGARDFGCL